MQHVRVSPDRFGVKLYNLLDLSRYAVPVQTTVIRVCVPPYDDGHFH